jgi:hypothetical protein
MLYRVHLVRTDVSEERSASIIRVARIGELGTTLAVTSARCTLLVTANVFPTSLILVTLILKALRSSEKLVLTRSTRYNIPEHAGLHSHRRENLKSYIVQKDILYCSFPRRSSGQSFWLQTQRPLVRFPALPDFLSSSGSGTGSTQARDDRATLKRSSGSGL